MSRLPLVNSFLCGCSLLTGSKIIGVAQVVINGLHTCLATYVVFQFVDRHGSEEAPPGLMKAVTNIYFEAICGVILLIGIYSDKPSYIKSWVVIQFAIMLQNVVNISLSSIVILVGHENLWVLTTSKTIALGLDVYYTIVVYSYYRKNYYRDNYHNLLSDEILDTLE